MVSTPWALYREQEPILCDSQRSVLDGVHASQALGLATTREEEACRNRARYTSWRSVRWLIITWRDDRRRAACLAVNPPARTMHASTRCSGLERLDQHRETSCACGASSVAVLSEYRKEPFSTPCVQAVRWKASDMRCESQLPGEKALDSRPNHGTGMLRSGIQ